MKARVRCPYCKHVHALAGGQVVDCCGRQIELEETNSGGFRTRLIDPRDPPEIKPIPQIVGWIPDGSLF